MNRINNCNIMSLLKFTLPDYTFEESDKNVIEAYDSQGCLGSIHVESEFEVSMYNWDDCDPENGCNHDLGYSVFDIRDPEFHNKIRTKLKS